jgi:hypothetical protein
MSTRSIRGKCVDYTTFIIALLAAQSIACAAQPPEASDKQSQSLAAGGGGSAHSMGAAVRPEEAVEFPRSVAMQGSGHITTATHQGFTSLPDSLKESAK